MIFAVEHNSVYLSVVLRFFVVFFFDNFLSYMALSELYKHLFTRLE